MIGSVAIYDEEHWREEFDHRAAILEYDGGLSRMEAEKKAGTWVAIERLRLTSETVQQKQQPKKLPKASERPAELQAILPGFETAYQGG